MKHSFLLHNKIALIVGVIGLVLIAIFSRGLYSSPTEVSKEDIIQKEVNQEEPALIFSKPADFGIIGPAQSIELVFNQPLENKGELKLKMEPVFEYDVELSGDRKTATIKPKTPFPAGEGYTIYIRSETKFDGKRVLEQDAIVHFKTVTHSGV